MHDLVKSSVAAHGGLARRWGISIFALWLIRQASPELAAVVSRYLLADLRSSQAPFIIPNHLAQADPLIQRFERWAREHLKEGFSLQEAADPLATSARTLQRRCEAVGGGRARRLLITKRTSWLERWWSLSSICRRATSPASNQKFSSSGRAITKGESYF
jgi:hypothetical protein